MGTMVVLLGGLVITQQYGIGRETSDARNFTIHAEIVQPSPLGTRLERRPRQEASREPAHRLCVRGAPEAASIHRLRARSDARAFRHGRSGTRAV